MAAGAPAPPALVDEVVVALREYGPVVVEEREVARESLQFLAPAPVRLSACTAQWRSAKRVVAQASGVRDRSRRFVPARLTSPDEPSRCRA